jgi:hypothetical protein
LAQLLAMTKKAEEPWKKRPYFRERREKMEKKMVQSESTEKIDIFSHIIPAKYKEALLKKASKPSYYLENTDLRQTCSPGQGRAW